MQRIHIAINEIKRVLGEVSFLEALLHSLSIFMLGVLILILLGFNWMWAFVPMAIFFSIDLFRLTKRFNLAFVERHVPQLYEQLRTAYDNLHKTTPIVESLKLDVLRNMKFCRTSYFVPFKTVWRHILIITILAFGILVITAFNVQFLNYDNIVKKISDLAPEPEPLMLFDNQPLGENFTDIFGNESIAELGLEQLELQINPVLSEININEIKPPEEQDFKDSQFPEEIVATADSSFDEDIPKEHKKIIKRYFQQIAQTKT